MMKAAKPIYELDEALTTLAKLYQFRSLEERGYAGLTVSQSYALRDLYFNGPRSMSELATMLRVRLSTMTGVIDQLERKGYVERIDHPEDRRSLHVRLTTEGRKLYQAAHDAFLSHLAPLVHHRSPADCDRLIAFLDEVTGAIRGWREGHRRKERRDGKDHP
ncbi:MAG TPA: MarR family transcriptional regulator [Planctomycetota bacterium]|nr:MarR family transcriptional regulator [Planctomycetota bacterium]